MGWGFGGGSLTHTQEKHKSTQDSLREDNAVMLSGMADTKRLSML